MKIKNGGKLWEKLKSMPFFRKPLAELSKAELEVFFQIAVDHVECDDGGPYGHTLPWYEGHGKLHIPWSAPEKYRYWEHNLTATEKYDLFLCMAVPPEDMHYFMYPAAIEEALNDSNLQGM